MEIVSLIYILLLSLNLIILIFKWYQNGLLMPFKIITVIIVLSISLEICTSVLFKYLPNNLIFYHIYNPLEFILYSIFFYHLSMSQSVKQMIKLIVPVFLIFAVCSSVFMQKVAENNSNIIVIESIFGILYSLLYLRHIYVYQIEYRAEKNPFFWITVGILFYFTGMLFVEGFLTFLIDISTDTARLYYKIGFGFKYLMCILILVGILVKKHLNVNS